ncbi:MAG TPA: hypothetical protein VN711_03605 [Candidatus Saccharimonadales bacterium]|nr:hypothetical protein [Candidatus Saccharimonadales bacterium]
MERIFLNKNHNLWLLFLPILLSVASLLSFTAMAQASTSATVTSTVTVQNVSVSVSSGTVSYGTLTTGASMSTLAAPGLADTQTVTNTGNVAEDFTIKGQNSANWTLDTTNSTLDHYIHKFCPASCGTNASPTNFTALTTSYAALGSGNVAANGTQTFDLQITTPQTSDVFTSQSVDVTVLASAH